MNFSNAWVGNVRLPFSAIFTRLLLIPSFSANFSWLNPNLLLSSSIPLFFFFSFIVFILLFFVPILFFYFLCQFCFCSFCANLIFRFFVTILFFSILCQFVFRFFCSVEKYCLIVLHFIFEFCACCNPEQTYNGPKTGMPVSASIYIFCFQLLNTVKKRLVWVGFAQNVKELHRNCTF